jgi:hypothetical protein
VLFCSSSYWSGKSFFDFSTNKYGYADWFIPRLYTQPSQLNSTLRNETGDNGTLIEFASELVNQTISVLAGAAVEEMKTGALLPSAALGRRLPDAGGVGTAWLKSLLGRNQWTLPCVNVVVRL